MSPTEQAMQLATKAARECLLMTGGISERETKHEVVEFCAEIILRETGLPGLVEACELAKDELSRVMGVLGEEDYLIIEAALRKIDAALAQKETPDEE